MFPNFNMARRDPRKVMAVAKPIMSAPEPIMAVATPIISKPMQGTQQNHYITDHSNHTQIVK
jgi:hypothetical protein